MQYCEGHEKIVERNHKEQTQIFSTKFASDPSVRRSTQASRLDGSFTHDMVAGDMSGVLDTNAYEPNSSYIS